MKVGQLAVASLAVSGLTLAVSAIGSPASAQQKAAAVYGPQPPAQTGDNPGVVDTDPTTPEGAVGAPGHPPTLKDALGQVYLTNPALLAERAKLRATDENVPSALSGWRPQVSVTVGPGYGVGKYIQDGENQVGQEVPTVTPNDRPFLSEQVSVSQPLYRGGRTTSATAQAESQVRAERARLLSQEEQSFADTVSAYVTAIEDQQLYALNVSNVELLSKTLDATNARFTAGEITRTDVAQAQAALAGGIGQRETSLGNLQTARAQYRRVIGDLPDKLVEPQPLAILFKSSKEAETLAEANNPTVIAAAYDDAASKDAVDVAYAALMPSLSFQGVGAYSDNTSIRDQRSIGGTFTANLTVPIYQGGAEYAAIRQAKQNEQSTRKTLDDTRRQAVESATEYYEQYVAAKSTVDSNRVQVKADEVALDGVEREALAGTETTLDVLNAEQLLLSARTTLVQNLTTLVSASYSLAGAVGRLTARDLNLSVPLYDETAYYNAVRDAPFGTGDEATRQPGR